MSEAIALGHLKLHLDPTLKLHLDPTLPQVPMAASVTTLAPCCYYTINSTVNGEYTTSWRLFGGHWSRWHRAPRTTSVSLARTPRLTLAFHAASAATTPSPLACRLALVGMWGMVHDL